MTVNIMFVKWSTRCPVVDPSSTTYTRKIEIESITDRSWRRHMACLRGSHREVKAEADREAGTVAHASIRVRGWSALEFSG